MTSLRHRQLGPVRHWKRFTGLLVLLAATQCALPHYRYEDDAGAGGAAGSDGNGGTGGLGGEGPAGGATSSGGAGTGGGPIVGDDCSNDGAFSCVANASRNRFVCEQGQLVAGESCGAGEFCDTQSGDGSCETAIPECLGHAAGEPFCEAAVRKVCGPDLVTISSVTCDTAQHCTQSTTDECAACLSGEFECQSDAVLRTCKSDNTGFDEQACPEENCSPTAGACTDDFCLVGQGHCEGDTLTICNESLTAFEDPEPCDPYLCDEVNAECDQCVAGSIPSCDVAGDTVIDCSADGQTVLTDDCEAPAAFCLAGAGACVGCTDDNDCPDSECYIGVCDTADTYTCSDQEPPPDTRCDLDATDDGYCDAGACIECRTSADCTSGTNTLCRADVCVDPIHALGWKYTNPSSMVALPFTGSGTPGSAIIYWFLLPPLDYDARLDGFGIQGAAAGPMAKMALYQGGASAPTTAVAAGASNLAIINGSSEKDANPATVTLQAGSRYWISLRFNSSGTVRGQSQASALGWIDDSDFSLTNPPAFNAATAADNNGLEWGVYVNVEDLE